MKKIIFLSILLFLTNILFAQSIHFSLQSGYNYAYAKEKTQIYLPVTNGNYSEIEPFVFANLSENTEGEEIIEAIPVSFAQGFFYGANLGFMYKKTGFEINAFYQKSQKYKANYFNETNVELQSTNLNLIPTFVYRNDTGKFAVISKLGIIIANSEINTSFINSGENATIKALQTGKIYFGAYLSVGAEYMIFNNLYISAYIDCSFLQYKPEKSILTEYTYQNSDQMPFIQEDYKTTYFVDSRNIDNATDNNKRIKPYYNMSSIGFKIGIKYNVKL